MNDNLKHKIIQYLNSEYRDLERYVVFRRWPSYTFFMKDGKILFIHNILDHKVYVCYDNIWGLLEKFFGLDIEMIIKIIKEWVGNTYMLTVLNVSTQYSGLVSTVEKHYRLERDERES